MFEATQAKLRATEAKLERATARAEQSEALTQAHNPGPTSTDSREGRERDDSQKAAPGPRKANARRSPARSHHVLTE